MHLNEKVKRVQKVFIFILKIFVNVKREGSQRKLIRIYISSPLDSTLSQE